ncbi:NADH:flavin oxidoreductase [Nocardia fluminea]|uniref:2,4-dienoyl-CoA reductase-like NADH-dependent reductase (Old Yellow Enzyme family) n=1 Tax=Nocardia fluminea TaxID=134984 RepID=A0A2N3V731_9NOCA|nr:NADH:flavin oxidoreductase [Nocardia fluminea]PKV77420.1 2,4-dienoyl-CoA reductase-like NADH-dependent reductase (Old Yellow Enzyme family) [Nocardia fluminea]
MTDVDALFTPLRIGPLTLPNRIVMSPMTRQHSPGGTPGDDVAAYYRRRAEGGTGLIITEGVAIDHPTAVDSTKVPRLHGDSALAGWRSVVDGVHEAGGRIVPQLWHVGPLWGAMARVDPTLTPLRPSGLWGRVGRTTYSQRYLSTVSTPTPAMTGHDIEDVIAAYVRSARNAVAVGFDGIAIHAGHGYLLDAFLWEATNQRTDTWGGDLRRRVAFPVEVVRAIRREIGPHLPIFYRFSQHKQQDYGARIAETPDELGRILTALTEAGVDVFDASSRHFDRPAFAGSDLTLAGWAKKLTGAHSMAVGSVGLSTSLHEQGVPEPAALDGLYRRLADAEFDLVAIGRLHLAEPAIARVLRTGAPLPSFDQDRHVRVLT